VSINVGTVTELVVDVIAQTSSCVREQHQTVEKASRDVLPVVYTWNLKWCETVRGRAIAYLTVTFISHVQTVQSDLMARL